MMILENFEFYSTNILNFGGAYIISKNRKQLCIGIWNCESAILSYEDEGNVVGILLNSNVTNNISIFDIDEYQDSIILFMISILIHSINVGLLGTISYIFWKRNTLSYLYRFFWWFFVFSYVIMKTLLIVSYIKALLGTSKLIHYSYRDAPSSLITSIYLADSMILILFCIEWIWALYEFIDVSRNSNRYTSITDIKINDQ